MRKIKTKIFFLAVPLCLLVFYLCSNFSADHDALLHENVEETQPATTNNSEIDLLPKCEQNMSAANISDFNSLNEDFKDFLYYQHCRSFPLLLDVPDKCRGPNKADNVFLLLVIKSSPVNYDFREVLRKTWAKERLHNGLWIRRIFISGTVGAGYDKARHNQLLEVENKEYNDILQWDFKDSFHNLTLKQILFLTWMKKNCPKVHFLMNGDDDVFANTDNMVEYLQGLEDNDGSKHLFAGRVHEGTGPVQWTDSKYYVPVQVHGEGLYPAYCGGGGFLLSRYTALVVYDMSQNISLHPIDDAYIGMCLQKAGLSPMTHKGMWTEGLYIPSGQMDSVDPCIYKEVLVVHRFLPIQTFLLWNRIHDPNLNCDHTKQALL